MEPPPGEGKSRKIPHWTLPRTEEFLIVPSWSKSRFSCSQKLKSGTFLQIIHGCLKTIVDLKSMLLWGHSSVDGVWKKTILWANLFSPSTPQKILCMAEMASPEMVCVVEQITMNYRDQDFLFHFFWNAYHSALLCGNPFESKKTRSSHMIQGWRWKEKIKSLQEREYKKKISTKTYIHTQKNNYNKKAQTIALINV